MRRSVHEAHLARKKLREVGQTSIREFEEHRTVPVKASPPPTKPKDHRPKPPPCPACGSESRWTDYAGSYGYTSPSMGIRCTNTDCGIHTGNHKTEEWSPKQGTYSIARDVVLRLLKIWEGEKASPEQS